MTITPDQRSESVSPRLEPSRRHAPVTLTALREHAGLSLRELEAETGIHRGRLSELERGLRWPKTSELRALEDFYDVPGLRVSWVIQVDEEAS